MISSQTRVLIVGASVAGVTAAEALRAEGFTGRIQLIGDEQHLPYLRPPLSKQVLSGEWDGTDVEIMSAIQFSDKEIEIHLSQKAVSLDLHQKVVFTETASFAFDVLIIATGSKARILDEYKSLRTFRTLDDAQEVRKMLSRGVHVGVVGAGVLGSEIATAARKLGSRVTLLGKPREITFGAVGAQLSEELEALHRRHGVEMRLGLNIESITSDGDSKTLLLESGESIDFDLAIAVVGSKPCDDWLDGSGLDISNGIVCGSSGQAYEDVFAIGDVAAWPNPFDGSPLRIEHQTGAIEQAMAVAKYLIKGEQSAIPTPIFWSDIHDVKIKAVGWFSGGELELLESEPGVGSMYLSKRNGLIQGALSWNAKNASFREARQHVESSVKAFQAANSKENK